MLSLTYVSSATKLMDEHQLADLLRHSREANAAREVTGMLLYAGGNIIQTLEGPDDAVREVFGIIQRDRRHAGVMVLLEEEVTERSFAEWTMAFRDLSGEDPGDGYSDYLRTGDLEVLGDQSGPAVHLLKVFRESMLR